MMWQDHDVIDEDYPYRSMADREENKIRNGFYTMSEKELHSGIEQRIAMIQRLYYEIDMLAEEARIEVRFGLKSERTPSGCDDVHIKWQSSAGSCGYF